MALEKVSIRNFRNVKSSDLGFEGNNIIISGKNMSGKTNTLNAIHWAFTGVTLDGSNDNRANFPIVEKGVAIPTTSVKLDFGDFIFERVCEVVDGTPTVSIYIDGDKTTSIKNGEARLHAKLGLTDIILTQPKGFNIVRFLLNPLYFDTCAPKDLRKFFYNLANINLSEMAQKQTKGVVGMLEKYQISEPYALSDAIASKKKATKKTIETCKGARALFPSIEEESLKLEKEQSKVLKEIESDEALAEKYALSISKFVNDFYQRAMGIKVCLLEKGVGDDVFKDVCYPILPESELPFAVGSYAERSYVGIRFIQEVCLKWEIKPLPILLDNMESLDRYTSAFVDSLGVQYIGALVK